MSEPAIFDFDAIRKAMSPETAEDEETFCETCYDSGWICYGIGVGDPHFRLCEECFNPKELPCP
jgi:hypothetical protein